MKTSRHTGLSEVRSKQIYRTCWILLAAQHGQMIFEWVCIILCIIKGTTKPARQRDNTCKHSEEYRKKNGKGRIKSRDDAEDDYHDYKRWKEWMFFYNLVFHKKQFCTCCVYEVKWVSKVVLCGWLWCSDIGGHFIRPSQKLLRLIMWRYSVKSCKYQSEESPFFILSLSRCVS